MAGVLVADTLQDGAGNSTSMDNAIYGSAKAWVNWTGGTSTINASYNVSSVTRSATGNYTVTFTNALADNKYAAAFATSNAGGQGQVTVAVGLGGPNFNSNNYTAPTASACQFLMGYGPSSAAEDPTGFCSAIFIR